MAGSHEGFILGVDLDDVCGDYTASFRKFVAAHRGVEPDELPISRSWDFKEWGLRDGEFLELHREAVTQQHMFKEMPLIEGAAEALWRLSDAGVWIRIITHRLALNWGHAVAVADTVEWLDTVGIPYRDLCFLGAKPQVEADCYIDDAPHNITALRASGAYAIVFDQPYNQHLPGPRAQGWPDVEHLVAERRAALGLAHQTALPVTADASGRLRAKVRDNQR